MTDERGQSWLQKVGNVRELNVLGFVVISGVLISFLNPTFLTLFNLQVIARQVAVFGILAIAETFVIIALGIELSVGSMVAFSGIIAALIITKTGSLLLAIVGVPLMSTLIGAYHGLMVTRLNIAPFIVTLGPVFMASMIYTNTTAPCPNNWTKPFDVASGVGYVISAAYCIPIGIALTRKKPKKTAEPYSKIPDLAKVRPINPGIAPRKASIK